MTTALASNTPPQRASAKKGRLSGWNKGTFRFRLKAFLPGKNLLQRRFSVTEAAFLMMLAYITSRGFGVVRQILFNLLFGTGPEANAYYAAARLPDTLFNLIAGGALTYAFIPIFISYERDKGTVEAWRLTSLLFNVLLVILTLIVLMGEMFAPTFVNHFLVPGYSLAEQELTAQLTRVLLLQPLILGLGTISTAVLTSRRQFLLPALSDAFYNIALIGGLVFTLLVPSVGIYGPTFGMLVAALFHVGIQLPGLVRNKFRYYFTWDLSHPGLREIMRLLIPNAMAIGIVYSGFIVDTAITSYLPDKDTLAALHNAQLLVNLLLALLAQAVSQAVLPQLAAHATAGRFMRMRQTMVKVLKAAIIMSVPGTILLCLSGRFLIRVMFQHGAFTAHSSDLTFLALIGFCLLLPGQIVGELLIRGFYGLKDGRTPLFTNIFALTAHCALIFLFWQIFKGSLAILIIPIATCTSATLEGILLSILLFGRLRREIRTDATMIRLRRRQQAFALQKVTTS